MHRCNGAKDRFGLDFKLDHNKVLLPEHLVHTVLASADDNESRSNVFKRPIKGEIRWLRSADGEG